MPRSGGPTPPTRTRTEIVLRVTAGPHAGQQRTLHPGDSLSIGRSEDADLPLADSKISRLHCRVESVDGEWILRDLDSRNGTWVGNRRIRTHPLSDGETFEVGKSIPVNVRIREVRQAPGAGRRVVFPPKSEADPAPAPAPIPAPPPALEGAFASLPGTQLGEVRVVEPVRPLGSGVFFRALQPSLNRHVMVEVFNEAEIARPGAREALQRGVQRAAPLLHPNVLQIFDYGLSRGFTYVTMELFQGRTLGTVLSDKGFVPIPRAISVARQLCEAFACGVDHGVPVGTVTPADVWVDEEFTVKVKFFREPGLPPHAVEHFAYQAPEILAGEDPVDPQSAVYTVGALLYHMLAATPPLAGTSREEFARRARHDTPPPLKRTNIKVSPMLARVVEQAMAKEPDRRQKGVRALSRDLQRSLAPGI